MTPSPRLALFRVAACLAGLLHCAVASAQAPSLTERAPLGGSFKVAGTVVNALTDEPLANARVFLGDHLNRAPAISTLTSETGHFAFENVPAGKFSLRGAARGFLASAYNQHEQFSSAIVTGAGLDTETLILRLMPLATITGTVLDERGQPVRTANVLLYFRSRAGGLNRVVHRGGSSTDDLGTYEFPHLAPGSYFVSATAQPWYAVHPVTSAEASGVASQRTDSSLDVAYAPTFYGGATDPASATPLEVRGGDHLQADIHLNPVPALHLVVRIPVEDAPRGFAPPSFQRRVFGHLDYVQSVQPQFVAPGVFEITGLPAGTYAVHFQGLAPPGGDHLMTSTAELSLTQSQVLDSARAEPSASVKITAKLPRDANPPRQIFFALQNSHSQIVSYGSFDATAGTAFEAVPPGKYSIRVNTSGKPYAVAHLFSEGSEIAAGLFEVTAGSSLDLTVVLVAGVVSVEGVVQRKGKPVAGVMVALVPKDPATHLELFRRDQSDLDGTFIVRDVIPGQYTIIAVEDAWGFEWLEPGVLGRYLQHGQTLNIGELMHNSVLLPEPLEAQPR